MRIRLAALALSFAALGVSGCSIELQHGLSEQDANEIYVLLDGNGIGVKKEQEAGGNEVAYKITVSKQDASMAAKLMREHSLPRPMQEGFPGIIKRKGMIPTAVEERAMFLDAVGGEVANSLNKVDGVLEAHVIVQIPEKSDLTQPDKKPLPTASVFVKYRATMEGKPPLDELQVRRFVAAAVEDLKPEEVTVILTQATPPSPEDVTGGRLQDVMGLRMAATSASTFKWYAVFAFALILAMAGVTTWTFLRGAGSPAKKVTES